MLVNKELMEFIFKNNKEELKRSNYIYYHTGNNKIIIDFKTRKEKYALLIIDPLKINNNNIYLIPRTISERNNKPLYENLLNNFSPYLINNNEYKNKIILLKDFINNKDTPIQSKENKDKQNMNMINQRNIRKYSKRDIKERKGAISEEKMVDLNKVDKRKIFIEGTYMDKTINKENQLMSYQNNLLNNSKHVQGMSSYKSYKNINIRTNFNTIDSGMKKNMTFNESNYETNNMKAKEITSITPQKKNKFIIAKRNNDIHTKLLNNNFDDSKSQDNQCDKKILLNNYFSNQIKEEKQLINLKKNEESSRIKQILQEKNFERKNMSKNK